LVRKLASTKPLVLFW